MNEVKIKDVDFKLMPNDQEFYFCIDLSGGKRVHRGGHIKAHPSNFISVLLSDDQTPKGKVISIGEVETCESCEKVFPAGVMELANPDDTALFCPACKKEGLIEMYKFFCTIFPSQFALYQNLIEEGLTEEEIEKVFAENPDVEIKFGTPEKVEPSPELEEIINDLQSCFKNGNQDCEGPHCQGCWKDILRGVIKKLEKRTSLPGTIWLLRTLFAELIVGHEDFPIDAWIEEHCVSIKPTRVESVHPIAYVFEGKFYSKEGLAGKTFHDGNHPQPVYKSAFSDVTLKLLKEISEKNYVNYPELYKLLKPFENADNN